MNSQVKIEEQNNPLENLNIQIPNFVNTNINSTVIPEKVSGSGYENWAIPQDNIAGLELEYYNRKDCLGTNAWLYGDLVSTLISNKSFYTAQSKHLAAYNVAYLRTLDKKLADYLKQNYNLYYYAYYLCHLDTDLDLVAGYLVPLSATAQEFRGEMDNNNVSYNQNLIIINKAQVNLIPGVANFDNTLTGGEVFPCHSQYSNQNISWACGSPKRFSIDPKTGETNGVYYDNWLFDLTGKILKKWETVAN
ncbi:MAG: hypothetical protein NT116_01560 [Candidatus Parcubacteria bacterium]|nr:hypothetical protein [Candidatus Parcubacteria bacterium]